MTDPPEKTAVVLSGGGAYGAFAVGVMKVIFGGLSPASRYEPFDADIFTGTSVGAFNASVMVMQPEESSFQTALRLEQAWLNQVAETPNRCGNGIFRFRGNPLQYLSPACFSSPMRPVSDLAGDSLQLGRYLLARTANFLASSTALEDKLVGLINIGSFVDSSPYAELLNNVLNHEGILRTAKKLRVIATNWVTGGTEIFGNGHFANELGSQAVRASTAIPGIFPPVQIGKDIYVDGGIVMNTPLAPAINAGATTLHVIYLDPDPQDVPLLGEPNTVDTLLRVYNMLLASKIDQDVNGARAINEGIELVESDRQDVPLAVAEFKKSLTAVSQMAKKTDGPLKLAIHRYFPRRQLGGPLGLLNFSLDPILQMIQEGETQALVHDCSRNECLVPGGLPPVRAIF